jgi:calcium-dependent protein kinase
VIGVPCVQSLRGTPYYIAPEVIKGQYNEACDMWSFGVVMFVMLFGYPPFHADADQEIFRQVLEGFNPVLKKGYKAHFPQAIPCSEAAKDLISKLLTSDTAKRLTADEALEHHWLTGEEASGAPMVLDVLTNLQNFSAHSKFKQGILNLMVNTLTENDLQKLKKLFAEIDADGNGHITVAELTAAVEKSGAFGESFGVSKGGKSGFTKEELQRILEAADIDGDGTLSYNELVLTTVQRKMSAKEERMWAAFCKLDLNRDGLLTIEELSSVLGEDIAEAQAMLKTVDKNGDGQIDFDEFLDLWLKKEESNQSDLVQQMEKDVAKAKQTEADLPPGAQVRHK